MDRERNLKDRRDAYDVIYNEDRTGYIRIKVCRCAGCSYCKGSCWREIARYPGPDPDDPDDEITVGRFNALLFCPGCGTARRSDKHTAWLREHRNLTRERHSAIRRQAKAAMEAAARLEEHNQLLEQENALLRQEIRRLGGLPDAPEEETEKPCGGVRGLIRRIAQK